MRNFICMIGIIIAIALFSSCNPKIHTYKVDSIKSIKKNEIIYNLPQTSIVIQIELTETTEREGPFSFYAEKYLGVKNPILKDNKEITITDIRFSSQPTIDSTAFYAISCSNSYNSPKFSFSEDGFLQGLNLRTENQSFNKYIDTQLFLSNENQNFLNYSDFSLHSNLKTKYDTLYKEIFKDSTFVKIPVIKQQTVNKSIEEQAKELAEQIFLLRDDRNALIKGEYDGEKIPDFQTFQFMLHELNNLEREYVSLFTGATIQNKKQYQFKTIPTKNDTTTCDTLFKFSNKYGILPLDAQIGIPILLCITPTNKLKTVDSYNQTDNGKRPKGLAYRIPGDAGIVIFRDKDMIAETEMKISQFGIIRFLPNNFTGKNTKIEFYTDFGSLKNISH